MISILGMLAPLTSTMNANLLKLFKSSILEADEGINTIIPVMEESSPSQQAVLYPNQLFDRELQRSQ